jgi:hypothetical protein
VICWWYLKRNSQHYDVRVFITMPMELLLAFYANFWYCDWQKCLFKLEPLIDQWIWYGFSNRIKCCTSKFKGAVSRRWLDKINGAKKRLKLMLHDWKRCSSLQFLKQSKAILHNEGIIISILYFTPNLINCWQTVFQVCAYFWCAVEPWHCPFKFGC